MNLRPQDHFFTEFGTNLSKLAPRPKHLPPGKVYRATLTEVRPCVPNLLVLSFHLVVWMKAHEPCGYLVSRVGVFSNR